MRTSYIAIAAAGLALGGTAVAQVAPVVGSASGVIAGGGAVVTVSGTGNSSCGAGASCSAGQGGGARAHGGGGGSATLDIGKPVLQGAAPINLGPTSNINASGGGGGHVSGSQGGGGSTTGTTGSTTTTNNYGGTAAGFGVAGSVNWSVASPTVAVSDRRMKHDISAVGSLPNGLRLYDYSYLGSDERFTGVMAQDLLLDRRFAAAVEKDDDGLMRVDYAMLGFQPANFEAMMAAGEAAVTYYRETLH